MRDIITDVDRWIEEGDEHIAIATVLKTYGSAPRGIGGKMAIGEQGRISGSISGGCVESTIIEEGMKMTPDDPPKILHFETSDENAWEVGLPCGGTIDVLLELLNRDHFDFLKERIARNERAFSVTVIGGKGDELGRKLSFASDGETVGSIASSKDMDRSFIDLALQTARSARIEADEGDEGRELFVEIFPPAPTLVAVGGVHIAIALVSFAKILGFRTVVIDPRKTFGSPERFPDVDCLIQKWPDEAFESFEITPETAIVVLTHDAKLDDPALFHALESPAFYIGALGSNRTQARRRQRLLDMGFSADRLTRIHGPVGLDIGASSPQEIALSIVTEIVALSRRAEAVLRVSDFARKA